MSTKIAGDIIYLDGAGQPIVVCNSLRPAFELLERRSANYSDRPRFIMGQEILNGSLMFALMNQDDRWAHNSSSDPVRRCRAILLTPESLNSWRRMRRASHEALTKRAVQNYHPILMKEATVLVSSLLMHSANHNQHGDFHRRAVSTVMSIVYDYPTILSDHDYAVEGIERFNDRLAQALTMGSYFVDIFPWMKYIPARSWPRFRLLTVNADG